MEDLKLEIVLLKQCFLELKLETTFYIVVKGGQQQEAGGKGKITMVITFN